MSVICPGRMAVRLGDVLRQEELELLIGEEAQLRTEHIVDADMVCIAPVHTTIVSQGPSGVAMRRYRWGRFGGRATVASGCSSSDSRKIGDGQRRVGIEVVRFYEALKQIPTHLERIIGA